MSQAELETAQRALDEALRRLEQALEAKTRQIAALQGQVTAATEAQTRQSQDLMALRTERDQLAETVALLELDLSRQSERAAGAPVPDTGPLYAEIARLEAENKQLRQTARDAARRVSDTIGRLRLAAQG